MTARLVALMSSLLFLSLLAFILLVRQSEEAVMEEVGKTVSKVGLETVRAVMSHGMQARPADGEEEVDGPAHAMVSGWSTRRSFVVKQTYEAGAGPDMEPSQKGAEGSVDHASANEGDEGVEEGSSSPTGHAYPAGIVTASVGGFGGLSLMGAQPQVIEEETANGSRYRIVLPSTDDGPQSGLVELVWTSPDGTPPGAAVLRRAGLCQALLGMEGAGLGFSEICLPQVPIRVDTEADGTMQVEIRLVASDGDIRHASSLAGSPPDLLDEPSAVMFVGGPLSGFPGPPVPEFMLDLGHDDGGVTERQTVFQMSTSDYGAVFEALRGRMWALFVAVALFGTLLSAGLARRFTRPVRDLDAAIRRLSRENLDVEVPVRGAGEVGRLTKAFNEMARRLRIARERSRELTRRERLSALGRLAAGVAHDVRNPLHSINLSLQHLQDTCRPEEPSGTEFDRTVGIIRAEIRRLDGLVTNFLRFARTGVGEHRPIEVDHLIRETGEVVAKEAVARGVAVRVDTDSRGAEVLAESDALRSALLNLVLNSFEAMPEGGEITLRSRVSDDVVTLEVTDDGAGIPAEDREQIFDFGYTSREDGHGLGLAMVHEIVVEEHDGRVEVESEEGVGTTIRIELPIATEASVGASA